MPDLPARPSLEHLRKQAKGYRRDHRVGLARAQRAVAAEYGFDSWPRLVRHVQTIGLSGLDRALTLADPAPLDLILRSDSAAATAAVDGMGPLMMLLRGSSGTPSDVRRCATLLLDAGADPNGVVEPDGGGWGMSALFFAVERRDLTLVKLLVGRGAVPDEDAFYHACEQSDVAYLDALHQPGFEDVVNHKLDFEDAPGLQWFLDHSVDVNRLGCLHWAIGRGRSVAILLMLIDAGADVNTPHADVGARPLEAAARCGHLAAYELLVGHGASAELSPLAVAVLAVARGESAQLPDDPPPMPGIPGADYRWILGQFAQLGRTEIVRLLLDAGLAVDSRDWSNFTPLDQAAGHGRVETVRLLIQRGADLYDCAFDDDGPTPLDCAIWGAQNNWAADGEHHATVRALIDAGAPTRYTPPTGNSKLDEMLAENLDRDLQQPERLG